MNYLKEIFKYKDRVEFLKIWYSERSFFTAAHLKYIAMLTMLLSHISQTGFLYMLGVDYWQLADTFTLIGRLAMPIFCFFTVQAIIFTKDIKKYFSRMLIFALIAEIPFDLAFFGMAFDLSHQNVIFTLLIGAMAIYLIDSLWKSNNNTIIKIIGMIVAGSGMMALANFMNTDYGHRGVLAIILLYLARNSKPLTALALVVGFFFEFYMPGGYFPITYGFVYLAIPLILFYNSKKGNQNKWLFYVFYPAHLLILFLMRLMII